MRTPQLIICVFLGMLGITMIIHFWGNWGLAAIVSDIVGIALIVIGVFSISLFFRKRMMKRIKG